MQHENPYSSPGLSVPDVLEANREFITALPDVQDINATLDYSLFSKTMSEQSSFGHGQYFGRYMEILL